MFCILACTIDYTFWAFVVSIIACISTIVSTWIAFWESRCSNAYIIRIKKCSFVHCVGADSFLFLQFENIGLAIDEPKVELQIIYGNLTCHYKFCFTKTFGSYEKSGQIKPPDSITRRMKFNCKIPISIIKVDDRVRPFFASILQNSWIKIIVKSNDYEVFSFWGYRGKEIKSTPPKVKDWDKYIETQRKKDQKRKRRNATSKEIRYSVCQFRNALLKASETNQH